LRLVDPSLAKCGLMDGDKILEFLAFFLRVANLEQCDSAPGRQRHGRRDRRRSRLPSGPIIPAVRASIALPGIFTPGKIGGRLLLDGGLINPCRSTSAVKWGPRWSWPWTSTPRFSKAGNYNARPIHRRGRMLNLFSTLIHSIYIMQRTVNLMRLEKSLPTS
jgi:NTE family protein